MHKCREYVVLTRRGVFRARIRAGFVTRTVMALAAVGLVGPAVSATSASPSAMAGLEAAADIPVLAQAVSLGTRDAGTPIVVSIHGVQRVEGGTIVYLSLGWPLNAEDANPYMASRSLGGSTYYFHSAVLGEAHCDTALIDQVGAKIYLPLPDAEACSPIPRPAPGEARVGAVLLAPLPPEVSVVDVSVHGTVLTGVPVGDGELVPAATGATDGDAERYGPVLGMGWPTLDLSQIPASTDEYVVPLRQAVVDLEGEITSLSTCLC